MIKEPMPRCQTPAYSRASEGNGEAHDQTMSAEDEEIMLQLAPIFSHVLRASFFLLPVAPFDADFTLLLSEHIKAGAVFTTYVDNVFVKL